MEHEKESGGTKARTVPALDARELTVRLLLAERAVAEQGTRIAELTAALAKLAGTEQRPAPAQPVVIDADAVSPFALGFYHREFDKLARPFRWTGKSELFELRLRLDRNMAWHFEVEVQPNTHIDSKKLKGYVDYIEIPLTIEEGGKVVTGTIPERTFGASAIVSFLLPGTYVPSVVNPAAQDNRTLGLIFYELRARPMAADGVSLESSNESAEPKPRKRKPASSEPAAETTG